MSSIFGQHMVVIMKITAFNKLIHHSYVVKKYTGLSFEKKTLSGATSFLHGGTLSIRHRVEGRRRGVEEGRGRQAVTSSGGAGVMAEAVPVKSCVGQGQGAGSSGVSRRREYEGPGQQQTLSASSKLFPGCSGTY